MYGKSRQQIVFDQHGAIVTRRVRVENAVEQGCAHSAAQLYPAVSVRSPRLAPTNGDQRAHLCRRHVRGRFGQRVDRS